MTRGLKRGLMGAYLLTGLVGGVGMAFTPRAALAAAFDGCICCSGCSCTGGSCSCEECHEVTCGTTCNET